MTACDASCCYRRTNCVRRAPDTAADATGGFRRSGGHPGTASPRALDDPAAPNPPHGCACRYPGADFHREATMAWATRMPLLGLAAAITVGAALGGLYGLAWELLR